MRKEVDGNKIMMTTFVATKRRMHKKSSRENDDAIRRRATNERINDEEKNKNVRNFNSKYARICISIINSILFFGSFYLLLHARFRRSKHALTAHFGLRKKYIIESKSENVRFILCNQATSRWVVPLFVSDRRMCRHRPTECEQWRLISFSFKSHYFHWCDWVTHSPTHREWQILWMQFSSLDKIINVCLMSEWAKNENGNLIELNASERRN